MKRLERIEDKLDKLFDKQSELNTILSAQHEQLKDHIRRTEILETKVEPIEKQTSLIKSIAKIISFVGMGVLLKILHAVVMK